MPRTSSKQAEILQFVTAFISEHGYAPSVREICQAVDLRSTASVHYHLNELRRLGKIEMEPSKGRTINVAAPAAKAAPPAPARIPLVGVVTAGYPILAVENIEGYLPWDGDENCFALRVRGDSMIGAGILDGDLVIVRPQPTASHGEIVVAMIGDEATVKRLSLSGGQVWLLPENPAFSPIDGREAVILGKVKGIQRTY